MKRGLYKGTRYTKCDRCDKKPGQVVNFHDDHDEALCYSCWKPLADRRACRVLLWINKYGHVMYARCAGSAPLDWDEKRDNPRV